MHLHVLALCASGLVSLTAAYTQPVGATPTGNPIYSPALNEIVPCGEPYTIKWNATSDSTVTLLLLRGPSADMTVLYPIVQNIPNLSSYRWTPSYELQADTTHYGIQLIQDSNGAYQYTSQFGISNSHPESPSSSSSSSATGSSSRESAESPTPSAPSAVKHTTSTIYSTQVKTITSCAPTVSHCPARSTVLVTSVIPVSTTVCPVTATHGHGSSSEAPFGNGTITSSSPFAGTTGKPTAQLPGSGNISVPTTTTFVPLTTSSSTAAPVFTTAAPAGTKAAAAPVASSMASAGQLVGLTTIVLGATGMLYALLL
ncbi:MAG: hypothetical protein M1838_003283 [Thelocarpon superellum]|nr:MAG: hypothetical protein M1838_003283 [Thelocarpon superellum]